MDPELLRREHERLLPRYETIIDSSFADFSLLSALGSVLGTSAFAEWVKPADTAQTDNLRLFGCLMALVIIVTVGLRDLLKTCIAEPYLRRLLAIEGQLRALAADGASATPNIATEIEAHRRSIYIPQLKWFGLYCVLALGAPAVVLRDTPAQQGIYAIAIGLSLLVYLPAYATFRRRVFQA